METLGDEIYTIMSNAIKEVLERTEGNKSARDFLINQILQSGTFILTYPKYKKDEKIAAFKERVEVYVNSIDKTIQDFSSCNKK